MDRGIFIVIEGTDGSGKGTQFARLAARLRSAGYDVATFDFPQYDSPSSYFVKEYLNGRYGTADEVGPYTGSLFYALDRYEAAPKIREALAQGKVVLTNRYVGSNMAHQGTKFAHAEERRGYFIWLDNLEFEMLKVPRPTVSFVLRVPAETAQQLVDKKGERAYTDKKRDLHEADLHHLKKSVDVYDDMCQLFPRDFSRIDCTREGTLLDIQTINDIIWQKVEPLLPPKNPQQRSADIDETAVSPSVAIKSKPQTASHPYLTKQHNGTYEITAAGRQWLEEAFTNITDPVYATTAKLESLTIARAMSRLNRGHDLRVTLLGEAAGETAEGISSNDSVHPLVGQYIVVQGISQLLASKLEVLPHIAYAESPERPAQKGASGYPYVIPAYFDAATKKAYTQQLDQLFDAYTSMAQKLAAYLRSTTGAVPAARETDETAVTDIQARQTLRTLLPAAATTTVGIFTSARHLEEMITYLLADELPEAQEAGKRLLTEARKVIPTLLEHDGQPQHAAAIVSYHATNKKHLKKLSGKLLPEAYAADTRQTVQLTDVWPRNELDLVPDMLYEHSNLPLGGLRHEIQSWSYDNKATVFETYIGERLHQRHQPGKALEKARYSWDMLSDFTVLRDLQRHRVLSAAEWQLLTPRFGYEVPVLIEEAGLADDYEACFDLSLRLHSLLQQNGYTSEAQYAVLLGHRLRWKLTHTARQALTLFESGSTVQHASYRPLIQEMYRKLQETHPMLSEAMKFVRPAGRPEFDSVS